MIPGKNPDYDTKAPRPWEVDALHGRLPQAAPAVANGSFEEPALTAAAPPLTPPIGNREDAGTAGWDFGFFAGIARAGEGPAEGVATADGAQVAFLRGDARINEAPSKVRHVFGTDLTGLVPGRKYELSWQQAGHPANAAEGQLAVHLNVPGQKSFALRPAAAVAGQGTWESVTLPFVAMAPVMRLNFLHAVAEPHIAESGDVTTLLDAVRIRALD